MIIKRIRNWLVEIGSGDLSKHRIYTHRYEDMCM